jgi:hypothetical protein
MKKDEFCQCNGNACPCGKFGAEILKCKKLISPERMQEIFSEMRDRIEHEKLNGENPHGPH